MDAGKSMKIEVEFEKKIRHQKSAPFLLVYSLKSISYINVFQQWRLIVD